MKKAFYAGCAAVAALALGLMAGCGGYDRYDDAALYSVGGSSVTGISSVDIEWLAGEVVVEVSPTAETVTFSEETDAADDALKLHYLDRAGELDIEYAAAGASIPDGFSKKLTVTVPATLSELDIRTTSASVTVNGAVGREMHIETRAGSVDLVLGDISGFILEYETRSGRLTDAYGAQLRERDTYLFGVGGVEIDVETSDGNLTLRRS